MALDRERWTNLWNRLGLEGPPEPLLAKLRRSHGQWWRAYHGAAHVMDCLVRLDEIPETLESDPSILDRDLLEMAFWFHDAIYVPWLPKNEERSARWAVKALSRAGLPTDRVRRVEELILATRHIGPDSDVAETEATVDAVWMVDIDLSILGASRERFDRYERQIRQEYRWVGASRYRAGRRAVLDGFLSRPSIYGTDTFRRRFEVSAKENLRRALADLGPV